MVVIIFMSVRGDAVVIASSFIGVVVLVGSVVLSVDIADSIIVCTGGSDVDISGSIIDVFIVGFLKGVVISGSFIDVDITGVTIRCVIKVEALSELISDFVVADIVLVLGSVTYVGFVTAAIPLVMLGSIISFVIVVIFGFVVVSAVDIITGTVVDINATSVLGIIAIVFVVDSFVGVSCLIK